MLKNEREVCWSARDKYWQCLDSNNENVELCAKFKKEFESQCPQQWVKHFMRRRKYDKFKEEMDKNNWTDSTPHTESKKS